VQVPLDVGALTTALADDGWSSVTVQSRAAARADYLRRPDLGRRLDDASLERLQSVATRPAELAIVVGDGLSAVAVQQHAAPFLRALRTALDGTITLAPLVIATQARVALADEIGALLQARLALILIGERPGLSSPDSMGAYLTYAPHVGRVDAQRNCVSNIRPEGLAPAAAAGRVAWLLQEALRRRLSGVELKDESAVVQLPR
jgi:ethanolamine ammonia-lyase small subunit